MADVTTTGMEGKEMGTQPGLGGTSFERKLDERKPVPREGRMTRRIERQTAKVPSAIYLLAAGISVAGSLSLFAAKRPISAIFVGLWPPTFLLLGNYNKMLKLANEISEQRAY